MSMRTYSYILSISLGQNMSEIWVVRRIALCPFEISGRGFESGKAFFSFLFVCHFFPLFFLFKSMRAFMCFHAQQPSIIALGPYTCTWYVYRVLLLCMLLHCCCCYSCCCFLPLFLMVRLLPEVFFMQTAVVTVNKFSIRTKLL